MASKRKALQTQFHRSQIGRAQRFIRLKMDESIKLDQIAREAGASPFHFLRIFLAYTGETPFDFLRRVRLTSAIGMLQQDPAGSITEIALGVGYETPSAFDKAFKRELGISPRQFRNLGKEAQSDLVYRLSKPLSAKQSEMRVHMSLKHETIARPVVHYLYLQRTGPFAEVAPPTWGEMFSVMGPKISDPAIGEYLGLSGIDKTRNGDESMIYQAGVGMLRKPAEIPKGIEYRQIPAGKYALFLLTGPYSQIWVAFGQIFRTLAENHVKLREEFCIENYINDPRTVAEDQLQTQILIPVT